MIERVGTPRRGPRSESSSQSITVTVGKGEGTTFYWGTWITQNRLPSGSSSTTKSAPGLYRQG